MDHGSNPCWVVHLLGMATTAQGTTAAKGKGKKSQQVWGIPGLIRKVNNAVGFSVVHREIRARVFLSCTLPFIVFMGLM